MSAKRRCEQTTAHEGPHLVNPLTPAGAVCSRAGLLAGASLFVLAAFGAPGAEAGCTGVDQTISTTVAGPILSTGGAITVLTGGGIKGDPTGVQAASCSVSTLSNGGMISGRVGVTGVPGGAGGAGVLNSQTISTLGNTGTISGGSRRPGWRGGSECRRPGRRGRSRRV